MFLWSKTAPQKQPAVRELHLLEDDEETETASEVEGMLDEGSVHSTVSQKSRVVSKIPCEHGLTLMFVIFVAIFVDCFPLSDHVTYP